MPPHWKKCLLALGLLAPTAAHATMVELFANGSASKSYLSPDSWTVSVSSTLGLAVVVIPHIRIEGRYTNNSELQNQLNVVSENVNVVNLSDIKTTTTIYSLGVDIDFFSETAAFKPYIFIGGGWVDTERSYYASTPGATDSVFLRDPSQTGLSANLGIGFRFRIAQSIAFETEAYAYAQNVRDKHPLVNLYGTVGVRIFI